MRWYTIEGEAPLVEGDDEKRKGKIVFLWLAVNGSHDTGQSNSANKLGGSSRSQLGELYQLSTKVFERFYVKGNKLNQNNEI